MNEVESYFIIEEINSMLEQLPDVKVEWRTSKVEKGKSYAHLTIGGKGILPSYLTLEEVNAFLAGMNVLRKVTEMKDDENRYQLEHLRGCVGETLLRLGEQEKIPGWDKEYDDVPGTERKQIDELAKTQENGWKSLFGEIFEKLGIE